MGEGTSDLGLVAFPLQKKTLKVEPFRKDRLVLICVPTHEFAKEGAISVDRLRKEIDASWPDSMRYLDNSLAVSTTARHLPHLFSRSENAQHDESSAEEDDEDKENV